MVKNDKFEICEKCVFFIGELNQRFMLEFMLSHGRAPIEFQEKYIFFHKFQTVHFSPLINEFQKVQKFRKLREREFWGFSVSR